MKKRTARLQRSDKAWLGVTCFLVLLQFWWLPGSRGTSADSYSVDIEGSRGLFRTLSTLSEQGLLPPVRRETGRLVPEEPCTLLVIGPERYPNEYEQNDLRNFLASGGTVVFATNWSKPDYDGGSLRFHVEPVEPQTTITLPPVTPGTLPVPIPAEDLPDSEEMPDMANEPQTAEAEERESLDSNAEADELSPAVETESTPTNSGSPPATAVPPSAPVPPTPPGAVPTPSELLEDGLRNPPGLLPPSDPTAPLKNLDEEIASHEVATKSSLVDGEFPWRTTARLSRFPTAAEQLVQATDASVQVAAWKTGQGHFVVSASSDPFSNRSMLFDRQAEFAVRLVEYAVERTKVWNNEPEIVMSEYLNGAGTYTGPELLISPALRAGTLQLVLTGVLLSWFGFHRFGPAIRDRGSERRSLAESATAVGNLQFQTGDGGAGVKSYLEWFRSDTGQRYGHDRTLDDIPALARLTGLPHEELETILATAIRQSETPHVSPHDAATSIRNLAAIHEHITGRTSASD